MVMFDSLNRHYLSAYGCDWTVTPNFMRLAERCMVFDKNYVGSLPCIPARREIHTGRLNFLHRSWGPLEPFDDSMPQLLKDSGVYTHIATDHMHYFEEGGATYHQRYQSWEVSRGEEGDPWKADVAWMRKPNPKGKYHQQDLFNRTLICDEAQYPQTQTFDKGLEFLAHNYQQDNWFLTIEAFDPHEPYQVPEKYLALYRDKKPGEWDSWPDRCLAEKDPSCRYAYAALVSMCDHSLGRVLDFMDTHQMWEDTMLILCTDHGYLLGEHGGTGKVPLPGYREVCNTPLMIWDPKSRKIGRCGHLTQMIDLAPTLLDYFGVPVPKDMTGHSLLPMIRDNTPVREAVLFGVHSLYTCCADERYLLMKAPDPSVPVYNYTLMPTHMHSFFFEDELRSAALAPPFSFTKGMPLLKTSASSWSGWPVPSEDLLFDLQEDPNQQQPLHDETIYARMCAQMKRLMQEQDAPSEYFARMGLA